MSRTSALFRLQEIDLELDGLRARLQTIEQALGDSPEVTAAQNRAATAREKFDAARVTARMLELDMQSLNQKITDAEKRLYSGAITNPKELRDLEADLASLRRRAAALEEQELEAMITAESAEGQSVASQTQLQQAEAAALQTHGSLLDERLHKQTRAEQLSDERASVHGAVSAEDRLLYVRLRQSKQGRPLAKLAEGCCSACGEEVSSSRLQEVRRGATLIRCSSCERILYDGND